MDETPMEKAVKRLREQFHGMLDRDWECLGAIAATKMRQAWWRHPIRARIDAARRQLVEVHIEDLNRVLSQVER
jgi:hypothetical protein